MTTTIRSALAVGVLALGAVTGGGAGPALADHSTDIQNCSDFQYYEDALEYLQRHPGDPDLLDDDGDGRPCESLPRRPAQAPTPAPAPCVFGAIGDRWASLGGANGFLGQPVTCELSTPVRPGRYNHFQGGSIYWSVPTGAWEVHGAIRDKWAALGWENSAIGFPRTNELRTPARPGAFNHFQAGSIYWSPNTGAREVRGAIRDAWARLGWENSALGFPITDEVRTTRGGAYTLFQGGAVLWSPGTGAHAVFGDIRAHYLSLGAEHGYLGFPISGEDPVPGGGRRVQFENGVIYWHPEQSGPSYPFGAWDSPYPPPRGPAQDMTLGWFCEGLPDDEAYFDCVAAWRVIFAGTPEG